MTNFFSFVPNSVAIVFSSWNNNSTNYKIHTPKWQHVYLCVEVWVIRSSPRWHWRDIGRGARRDHARKRLLFMLLLLLLLRGVIVSLRACLGVDVVAVRFACLCVCRRIICWVHRCVVGVVRAWWNGCRRVFWLCVVRCIAAVVVYACVSSGQTAVAVVAYVGVVDSAVVVDWPSWNVWCARGGRRGRSVRESIAAVATTTNNPFVHWWILQSTVKQEGKRGKKEKWNRLTGHDKGCTTTIGTVTG